MTLTDLAALANILSSLAIVASLVYLGLQTHQNVKHTRALIHQGRTARTMDIGMRLADADLSAAVILASGGVATAEAVKSTQFSMLMSAMFSAYVDSFTQHAEGLLGDAQFGVFRGSVMEVMKVPAARERWAEWSATRTASYPTFKAFIDDIAANAARTTAPSATLSQ